MNICSKCGEAKTPEEFSRRLERPKGHHSWCKKCMTLDQKRRYREKNPDTIRDGKLKASFGIGLEDYNKLLASQDNVCAICKQTETTLSVSGNLKALAVDHCHTTGKVRGLLCQKCNQALGLFNDDVERLSSAIKYIKEGL